MPLRGRSVALLFTLFSIINFVNAFAQADTLFSSTNVVKVTIKAPFKTLFHYRTDHDFVHVREYSVMGQLEYNNGSNIEYHTVKIRIKGKSTVTFCSFPKLELKFKDEDKDSLNPSLFFNSKSVDIVTHCYEENEPGDQPGFKETFYSPQSPHRESFLYQLAKTLNINTFKSQPAIITYIDTSDAVPKVLGERNAAFIEDTSVFLKRMNAEEILSKYDYSAKGKTKGKFFENLQTNNNVDLESVVRIYFFNSLISNGDWYIKSSPKELRFPITFVPEDQQQNIPELWNVRVITTATEKWYAFPYDFNLSMGIIGDFGLYEVDRKIKSITSADTIKKVINEFRELKQNLFQEYETVKADSDYYKRLNEGTINFYIELDKLESELNTTQPATTPATDIKP